MLPIYNKEGEVVDVSDNGSFVSELENRIDKDIALKKLTKRQQKINLQMELWTKSASPTPPATPTGSGPATTTRATPR